MLFLKVNNESLDLTSGAVISINEESPVFEKDSIPGGFAFPFDLPVTSCNRRILGFPDRIEKAGLMSIEQDFELYHSGQIRATGTIHIKEADQSYRAYLTVGSGDFASKVKDKKLQDLSLGGERTWAFKPEFKYPDDDFTIFPVFNPTFMVDTYKEGSFESGLFRINAYENGAFYNNQLHAFAVTPFPFLGYVIKELFTELGFQIVENCIELDPDLRDLVLYSTKDITSLIQTTEVVEVFLGIDEFGREMYEYQEVTTVERGLDKFRLSDCVPEMTIKDFILWLRNRFNLAFVFDRYNRVKIIKRQDLVLSHPAMDITDQAIGSPKVIAIEKPEGFALKWEHDPDDDLFSDENFQKIDDFLSYLKEPVANTGELSGLEPEINEIRLVESLGYYYRYAKFELPAGGWRYQWQQWSIGFQNYLEGEMEEVFSTGFSTLRMLKYQRELAGPTIRCPWAEQKGNTMEREEPQPFSPRLLFYRGMIYNSQDDLEPMGSNDNFTYWGNKISGKNLILKWDGEYGIYNQLWKDYLTWWLNRKQVNWMIKDPSVLEFNQKYAIDRSHYLLKKRTIHFSTHEITPGECEWYLV